MDGSLKGDSMDRLSRLVIELNLVSDCETACSERRKSNHAAMKGLWE